MCIFSPLHSTGVNFRHKHISSSRARRSKVEYMHEAKSSTYEGEMKLEGKHINGHWRHSKQNVQKLCSRLSKDFSSARPAYTHLLRHTTHALLYTDMCCTTRTCAALHIQALLYTNMCCTTRTRTALHEHVLHYTYTHCSTRTCAALHVHALLYTYMHCTTRTHTALHVYVLHCTYTHCTTHARTALLT